MARKPEFEGGRHTIVCLELPDGSCPVGEFLDALKPEDRVKIDLLFQRLGDHGPLYNSTKMKKVEGTDGVFEFKSFQIRIFWFYGRDKTVQLAHAVWKKKDKHTPSDIRTAEQRRATYYSH